MAGALAANSDRKKYNKMENVLQYINRSFVTVNESETKRTNPILKHVITEITSAMKKKNKLFEELFTDIYYGGSYFDGLKVGKPVEFDIDLRLVLPKLVDAKVEISNQPGFVKIKLNGWSIFEKNTVEYPRFKGLEKFKDNENYLLVNEVMKWMESIVTQALNTFQQNGKHYLIPYEGENIEVSLKKSGPALTAVIKYGDIGMDVDLVAVFKLLPEQWPPYPFKKLPANCNKATSSFMIVPKGPKSNISNKDRYWRMSFQEQEKVILSGLNTCKNALRMIKKLRDTQNQTLISSYFIKTVFLHEIDKQTRDFWNAPLSFIFMHMLKTYKSYLDCCEIPYYWETNNNLLQYIDKIVIDNFKNFLARVIDAVDKKFEDNPCIIADYLSTPEEQADIKAKINLVNNSKKFKEQNSIDSCASADLICLLDSVNICQEPETKIETTKTVESKIPLALENNDKIISLLQGLQSSINVLQSDFKFTMKKISDLEYSMQELKNDNVEFKTLLSSNSTTSVNINFEKQIDEQSVNIEMLTGKLEYLNKSVETLQNNNEILKNGLKSFVSHI